MFELWNLHDGTEVQLRGLLGSLARMNPGESDEVLPDDVEGAENPHDFATEEVDPSAKRDGPAPEEPPAPERPPAQGPRRVRITQRDLDNHETTPGCPRCVDIDYGNHLSKKAHSEECRNRFYAIFKAKNDAKWATSTKDISWRRPLPSRSLPSTICRYECG